MSENYEKGLKRKQQINSKNKDLWSNFVNFMTNKDYDTATIPPEDRGKMNYYRALSGMPELNFEQADKDKIAREDTLFKYMLAKDAFTNKAIKPSQSILSHEPPTEKPTGPGKPKSKPPATNTGTTTTAKTPPNLPKQDGSYPQAKPLDPNNIFKTQQAEMATERERYKKETQELLNAAAIYQAEQQQRMENNAIQNQMINGSNASSQLIANVAAANAGAQAPNAIPAAGLPSNAQELGSILPLMNTKMASLGNQEAGNYNIANKVAQEQVNLMNTGWNNKFENAMGEYKRYLDAEKIAQRDKEMTMKYQTEAFKAAQLATSKTAQRAYQHQEKNAAQIVKWQDSFYDDKVSEVKSKYVQDTMTGTWMPDPNGKITSRSLGEALASGPESMAPNEWETVVKMARRKAESAYGFLDMGPTRDSAKKIIDGMLANGGANWDKVFEGTTSVAEREERLNAFLNKVYADKQVQQGSEAAVEFAEMIQNPLFLDILKNALIYGKGVK